MTPTPTLVRIAHAEGRPIDRDVIALARAVLVNFVGDIWRRLNDPNDPDFLDHDATHAMFVAAEAAEAEVRILDATADGAVYAQVIAGYRQRLKEARRAGDAAEVRRWTRALRELRRRGAVYWDRLSQLPEFAPPPRLADELADALAQIPHEVEAGPDPPRPLDAATTSPHRPCAPPTSLTRGMSGYPTRTRFGLRRTETGVIPLAA